MHIKFLVFLFAFVISVSVHAEIVEEIITLPVKVKNIYGAEFGQPIVVTIFRDDAKPVSSWLVLNHGRPNSSEMSMMGRQRYVNNSHYFVNKGFIVFVPTRVGYGPSKGTDVEYSGECGRNNYLVAYQAAVDQVLEVINYAKKLPYVNSQKGLVVGQSFGGMTSIAVSTYEIQGLKGVVNFSGGGGGNPISRPENPCGAHLLSNAFSAYGEKTKVPSLWFYSSNDRFWGEKYPKEWFESFKVGADINKISTKFIQMPPFKDDGHSSFTGNPKVWRSQFEDFIKQLDF